MKILYVEDQLAMNLDRALRLFGDNVLSKRQKKKLSDLTEDEYGAKNEDVRDVLMHSGVLDVETSFPEALRRIEEASDKYDLFIVDRQLATDENAYCVEDLRSIVPDYSANDHAGYLTREGDYLLMRLMAKGDMAKVRMFYFMTGFTDDVIRTQDSL
ncbi:MAG: hypothetical protein EOM12_08840 [Verrucomicrobiae bacterium]|nr:hypothetical protein [Verrucomicrobiae bacterium]